MENVVVFDIESDGFYYESTKIWTIHALNKTTGDKISINPFKMGNNEARKELLSFFSHADVICGHNILGFDMFLLRKLLGISFQVGKKGSDWLKGNDGWGKMMFLDTYFMSMFLWPDRNYRGKVGHSLEWWGNALKYPKIDYREELIKNELLSKESPKGFEFSFYSPLMEKYCERDVDVTSATLDRLLYDYHTLYGEDFNFQSHFKMGQKSFYLMNVQELSGWPFDVEKATSLKAYIEEQMKEIEDKVEPQLPSRGLKKSEEAFYTMPATPFKKDGELSSHMVNFIEKHNAKRVGEYKIEVNGKEYDIASKNMIDAKMPMKLTNQEQIKDWLMVEGWSPTMWNYVKEEDGSKKKTSPKLQENGVICPNLLAMETGIIKDITMWMSLRNRLGVIEGWLDHPRLSYDGRLPAGSRGLASSHRCKHRCIVNVPSTTSVLGSEMRELFKAEKGYKIAAADASGLELRMQAHYTYRYDEGKTAKILLEGDPHASTAKKMFPKETETFDIDAPDFDKDHPDFKPWRGKAKTMSYLLLYGGGDSAAAKAIGVPVKEGKTIVEKFWQANQATKDFKDAAERWFETVGLGKYILALDNRILHVRAKYALVNTLFQSAGAIVMDMACCLMDMWLGAIHYDEMHRPHYVYKGKRVYRIGFFHDELEFLCEEEIVEEVADMIVKAIVKSGEVLKLKVPLAGDAMAGNNWKETH